MKTVRQREDERREEKLRQVHQQIEDGSLVVRRMTPRERAAADAALERRVGRSGKGAPRA
jgi:hypothetical protein